MPSSKVSRAVFAAASRRRVAVQQARRFARERLLRFVDLGALQGFEAGDLGERQKREQPQEAPDIGIFGVAPELPIIIRAEKLGIEPHRARGRLAHLGAGRGGEKRCRERVELRRAHAPAEIDAGHDVSPLVGAAHLQVAADAARQFDEIIGLQAHVVELDERHLLIALEAQLHRIHREHAIDREVAAHVTQELDVIELGEPLGIVEHHRVALVASKAQEAGEHLLDAFLVGLDLLERQKLARLIASRRIAHPRRPSAHQRDRLVAGLLEPVEHHDLDQRTDMERDGGAIEADIAHHLALDGKRIEAGEIGALVDEPPLVERPEEFGFEGHHGLRWALPLAAGRRRSLKGAGGRARPDELSRRVDARRREPGLQILGSFLAAA